MKFSLPRLLWYENDSLDIELPDEWEVEYCPMRGADRPALTAQQVEDAILHPVGTPRLRDLARGKKRAVILFDDMTRPTRIYELAPVVLQELTAGGIREEDIVFVCALGTHGALTQNEFRKKLGPEIVEKFRVFNHNIYENCLEVGTTSRGTRLFVNREVMEADLKIGIGCVTAHAQVGFSGGGKIVLPGVSHIDSIAHYHLEVESMARETTGLGNFDNNILRFEIEEAARMTGIDFLVNVTVNARGEASALFAGELFEVHEKAVALAKGLYATEPRPRDKEVVIANAFVTGMEYFNTFGGNPVSCAIGMAVMDVIEDEGLQENAARTGNCLLAGLRELMGKYPLIGDVRGLGLYAGVELVLDRETLAPATEHADYIVNRLRDHGILISTDGPLENVLKMKPPLVFSEKNADEVVTALDKILQEDCLQV